jgi:hypothetical protein
VGERVPASVQTDQQIRELLDSGSAGGGDVRSELIRLRVRRIIEEALEPEVEYFARHPALEGRIRGVLPAIAVMEDVRTDGDCTATSVRITSGRWRPVSARCRTSPARRSRVSACQSRATRWSRRRSLPCHR